MELEDRIVAFAARCVKVCAALPVKNVGVAVDDSVRGALALVVLCVPCIIMGTVGIVLRWRWRTVLFSCISEILLFPVWFFLLFMVCLFFDCSD